MHKKTGNRIFFNGFPVIFSVYERIRTSDPSLRCSSEFCLSLYQKLSNIACFQGFWMVRIASSYHCFHLIPVRRRPSLLQPCCKARKFSRTSSVSIIPSEYLIVIGNDRQSHLQTKGAEHPAPTDIPHQTTVRKECVTFM